MTERIVLGHESKTKGLKAWADAHGEAVALFNMFKAMQAIYKASPQPQGASDQKLEQWYRDQQKPIDKEGTLARPPIAQNAIFDARAEITEVQISEPMEDYIVSLVAATRRPAELGEDFAKYIQVGVSPRGSIALDKCSRAYAWLQGRDHVTPDDIRAVITDCLRHRIVLSYEASAEALTTEDVISQLVKLVAVA